VVAIDCRCRPLFSVLITWNRGCRVAVTGPMFTPWRRRTFDTAIFVGGNDVRQAEELFAAVSERVLRSVPVSSVNARRLGFATRPPPRSPRSITNTCQAAGSTSCRAPRRHPVRSADECTCSPRRRSCDPDESFGPCLIARAEIAAGIVPSLRCVRRCRGGASRSRRNPENAEAKMAMLAAPIRSSPAEPPVSN